MGPGARPVEVPAVGFEEYGDADVLRVVRVVVPQPGAGQVRVRTLATPVNPADVLFREGGVARLVGDRPRPYVPGLELSGWVESVGPGVGLRPGDPVLGVTSFIGGGRGCQSALAVLDAADVARVPQHVDLLEASTLPMSALTALATLDRLDVAPGDTLVVLGASGAVGGFVVQLAALRGLRAVAVADERWHPLLRAWGAATCSTKQAWGEDLSRTHPRGVAAVADTAVLGSAVLPALRPGGSLAVMRPLTVPDQEAARAAGLEVHLISVRAYQGDPVRLAGLVDLVATGQLHLRVDSTRSPSEAAVAHRRLDEGGLAGRQVLVWPDDDGRDLDRG